MPRAGTGEKIGGMKLKGCGASSLKLGHSNGGSTTLQRHKSHRIPHFKEVAFMPGQLHTTKIARQKDGLETLRRHCTSNVILYVIIKNINGMEERSF